MDNWQALIDHFQQQLISLQNNINKAKSQPEISCLTGKLNCDENPLAWLKAQSLYPQFYLHLRNEQADQTAEKILALGKLRVFDQAKQAQRFSQQHQLRLFGGLQFSGESYFFLPRLAVQQQGAEWHFSLFIDHQQDFQQEYQAAQGILKTLKKSAALLPVKQPVQLVAQKAHKQEWIHWVEKALRHIQQGELNKVVLANESQFRTQTPINGKDLLAESEKYNLGCYHFLFAQNAEQCFVGSSPERLYQRQGNQLYTEALAGTALMSDDADFCRQQADWLLNDPKNDYENRLVVDGICHNIQPYAEQIEVAGVELKQLRQVQHLRRKIKVSLQPQVGDNVCLKAIHPTAAIAGLPLQKAQQFLAETENFSRYWYAGTLGFMQPEQAEFCVTLRSALISQQQISVFAGAGIVAGSEPELEWQEIERKASGLLSLIEDRAK